MTLTESWRTRLRAMLGVGMLAAVAAAAWAVQGWRKNADIDHLKAEIAIANQAAADARADRTRRVLAAERGARDEADADRRCAPGAPHIRQSRLVVDPGLVRRMRCRRRTRGGGASGKERNQKELGHRGLASG